jgi:hypothetical protein
VTSPTASAGGAAAPGLGANGNGNGALSPSRASAGGGGLPPLAPIAPGSYAHSSVPASPNMAVLAAAAVPVPAGGYTGPPSVAAKPKNTCGCSGGDLKARDFHGPYLKIGGYVPDLDAWTGSCLVVCKAAACERPVLHWRAVPVAPKGVPVARRDHPTATAASGAGPPSKRVSRRDGAAVASRAAAGSTPVLVQAVPGPGGKPAAAATCAPAPPAGAPEDSATVFPVCLDTFCEWNFWRFDLAIPVDSAERRVEYRIEGEPAGASAEADAAALRAGLAFFGSDGCEAADPAAAAALPSPTRAFYVAGRDQPWHWGYYSCNGFTPDVPEPDHAGKWRGIAPLWEDAVGRHALAPMHAMVGGGDQLYNDDVLKCP